MSTEPPVGPPEPGPRPGDPDDAFVRRLTDQLDGAAGSSAGGVPDGVGAAVIAQLADEATWTPPPGQLRDDVLARVLGPSVRPLSPRPTVATGTAAPAEPAGEPGTRADAVVRPLTPRWRRLTWAVPAVAAAAVLITGAVLAVDHSLHGSQAGASYVAVGTRLAPHATARVTVAKAAGGFSVVLDLHGLPPAPAGTYYSAWLNDGHVPVPLGSFHARGDGGPIKLWSGVDPRVYTRFTVTRQRDDQPPFPVGQRYLSGTVSR